MKAKSALMFSVALFGSTAIYDFIGHYADSLPSKSAYFLGVSYGGIVVGLIWVISLKGHQHDN